MSTAVYYRDCCCLLVIACCLLFIVCCFLFTGACSQYGDAEHITAILGESVILNCPVSHPKIAYIIQWKKQVRIVIILFSLSSFYCWLVDRSLVKVMNVTLGTFYFFFLLLQFSLKRIDRIMAKYIRP